MKRRVFFISDHTGITAENLGRSLLSQFDGLEYDTVTWPFVDSVEKSIRVMERINEASQVDDATPIVFMTLVDPDIRRRLHATPAHVIDYFGTFTAPLEAMLGKEASHDRGRYHGMGDRIAYNARIHAVNFALSNDDGAVLKNYPIADLVLIGVSRSGKTPTCLYLGMQYGILAANYPLTDDDLERPGLPPALAPHRAKLFGLTIDPQHLQRIRRERRSAGRYGELAQCRQEVAAAEALFRRFDLPYVETTSMSVEEIAASIMHKAGLVSRMARS